MAEQPSLDSIAGSFAALEATFQPQKATGVDQTFQFNFTGREPGTWAMTVRNGAMSYAQGPATNPNVTLSADSDEWLKILRNEVNPTSAFMSGALQVQPASAAMGLLRLQDWFPRQ